MASMNNPESRTIVCLDVAGFSGRPNPAQLRIREALPVQVATAFSDAGIDGSRYDYDDRGDGALIVLPAEVDPLPVLGVVVPALALAVARHNAAHNADPARQFVLRVAVNWGTVHRDGGGFAGSTINETARLVDAEPLRRALRKTGAALGVAVSTSVYDNYVRHDYGGIEHTDYVESRVVVKQFRSKMWIRVPHVDTRIVRRTARTISAVSITVAGGAVVLLASSAAWLHGGASDDLKVELPNGNGWASVDAGRRGLTVCDTRANARGVRLEFTVDGQEGVQSIRDGNGSYSPCESTRTGSPITATRVCESGPPATSETGTGPEVCSEWVSS
jgi:hypothetical protein